MGAEQISDDQIFRRKLLMDGEGMGDERRLNSMLKSFIKYMNPDLLNEERSSLYVGIMNMIDSSVYSVAKSVLMDRISEEEIQNYEQMSKNMNHSIQDVEKEITQQKLALIEAKRIRKNKLEYQSLVKLIKEQLDRKETLNKLQVLREEIDELEKTRDKLSVDFAKKSKLFHRLSTSVFEIKELFEDDTREKNEETGETYSLDVAMDVAELESLF